jgi:putative ABC transport system permease protein
MTDLLLEAIRNIRAHWLRVMLTGSGIAWGIALFVALTAIGTATRAHYREKMAAIGRNVIYIFPGAVPEPGASNQAARPVVLELDDPPRLPASPLIERAAPELWAGPRVLKGGTRIKIVWTYGVGAESGRIRNFEVERGRFISSADVAAHRRVLVIGATVERRLFGRRSAIGQRVRLDGIPFRIIGVSKPKGDQMINMGPNDDEQVLLPISTAQTLFTHSDRLNYVIYEPRSRPEGAASTDRVRAILSQHHYFRPADEEALSFFNITDALKLTDTIGLALHVFLVACGLLTLVAGGIGVMNIMLVAVAERTRELGLRKALGATDRDLFIQLLGESVLVTISAGAAGVAFGAALIALLGSLRGGAGRVEFLMPAVRFSPELALLAFAVLVAVGLIAGIVPARRAARLDPAVALREE